MGTLTRLELRDLVEDNLGNRQDITTRINTYLNHAQLRIARAYNWDELQKTDDVSVAVVGTPATDKRYTHGITNLRDFHSLIRQVSTNTPWKLRRIMQRQWDQLILTPEDRTEGGEDARYYSLWDDVIELWPVPTRNYNLQRRYTIWPADLAIDGAKSDLERKDDMIVAMATHIAFQSLGMREDAGVYFAIYQDMLTQAKKTQGQKPDLVRVGRGISEGKDIVLDPVADPFVKRID